jgi:hypothetical protein
MPTGVLLTAPILPADKFVPLPRGTPPSIIPLFVTTEFPIAL